MISTLLINLGIAIDTVLWGMMGIPTIDIVEGLTDIIYALQNMGL
jgi:hypothetical protein